MTLLDILKKKMRVFQWIVAGRPFPTAHAYKSLLINNLRRKYHIKIFVETGTYLGDMVYSQRNAFEKIHSVEVSESLYIRAKARFKMFDKVNLYLGDSAVVIQEVIKNLNESALFWLDGH